MAFGPGQSFSDFRDLRGRHVLVTGGSSGIGLAIARQAAVAGAKVSLIGRDREKLAAAQAAIRAVLPGAPPTVAIASADVALEDAAISALVALEAVHGPVDILVTSAGIAQPGYFEEVPIAVFERTMAVNYFGTLYLLKAVVPAMRQRGHGAVVLVSSGAGLLGIFGYTPYAPSKFALRGLAEALRAELDGTGVHVAICYPPDTDTPQLAAENRTKPAETKAITAAAGQWTADDVARATWAGLARGQFAITPGFQLTALSWLHSVLAPLLRWHLGRIARRARRTVRR